MKRDHPSNQHDRTMNNIRELKERCPKDEGSWLMKAIDHIIVDLKTAIYNTEKVDKDIAEKRRGKQYIITLKLFLPLENE